MGTQNISGGGASKAILDADARRLLEAYETEVGALPVAAQDALSGGKVDRARLEAVLATHAAPEKIAKAKAAVEAGRVELGHGGTGLVNQIASLKQASAARPKSSWLTRYFGNANERAIARLEDTVAAVDAAGAKLVRLDAGALKAKTDDLRARLAGGAELDTLLPEAFANAREVSSRVLGLRHYDTQVMGGVLLHQGKIAEMMTGEGKTLAATLPVYLNALSGDGVHVITVNDYLAKRDAQWMGPVYHALGLTVGVLQDDGKAYVFDPSHHSEDPRYANLRPVPRAEAYAADITHGTNNEFGFDYLRDNIAHEVGQMVQRKPGFAIIDEVDNVLIDEARTPMIISGPSPNDPSEMCKLADHLVRQLELAVRHNGDGKLYELEREHDGDYIIDDKARTVTLTERGLARIEGALKIDDLYADPNLANRIHKSLEAHTLFDRDDDYIVKGGEVVIVDPNTGRTSEGRRWSNGLHQAVEAKEGVEIKRENETLARISVQNYFRRYDKLAGMTGTAASDAAELNRTFGLDVVTVPTNRPVARVDEPDRIYISNAARDRAVVDDIAESFGRGQPVLLGTTSVERSEALAAMLEARGIPHQVLNAKAHEQEALIVAQAGRPGMVTIATNMAGRGTDIKLGGDAAALAAARVAAGDVPKEGLDPAALQRTLQDVKTKMQAGLLDTPNPEAYAAALLVAEAEVGAAKKEVLAQGGLRVIGTARHESRRIDNQLLGRAGRQGDPGSSVFYLSLEDELMTRFGSDTIGFVKRVWGEHRADAPIVSGRLSKAVGRAQSRVEGMHAETRKNLLEYDDVLTAQRERIYEDRHLALEASPEDLEASAKSIFEDVAKALVEPHARQVDPEARAKEVAAAVEAELGLKIPPSKLEAAKPEAVAEALTGLITDVHERAQLMLGPVGPELMRQSLVQSIDQNWRGHLDVMDNLKSGIHLRAYAQKDPLTEYKIEAFGLFQGMRTNIQVQAARDMIGAGLPPAA